jgi:V8-like Glu-specific endopeptidase
MRRLHLLAAIATCMSICSPRVLAQDRPTSGSAGTEQSPGATSEALKTETTQTRSETTTHLVRKAASPQEAKRLDRYRSRAERLAAKPVDVRKTSGEARPAAELPASEAAQGEPGSSSTGRPNPRANAEARRLHPNEWRAMQHAGPESSIDGLQLDSDGRIRIADADIFTQYPEVNVAWPEVAIGKLFNNEGFCSASVVSGNNVIVTAAHCCWDRSQNNWIGGWSFAPAYNNGSTPFGLFGWSSATVLNSWINNGDVHSDVCVIKLQNDGNGRGVTFYTGWLGRSWNWPATQIHHALGYPVNIGGGNSLELCVSESNPTTPGCGSDNVLDTGCSMTFGSSGGPWIRNYRTDSWVNSVVHGPACTGTFGSTFNGGRFTTDNIVTLCDVEGC